MQKLDKTFKAHSINFDESKCVFNVFTKKVLNPKLAEEFLAYETIGIELLEIFIKERFEGEKLIWDPITKRKLPTFRPNCMHGHNCARNVHANGVLRNRKFVHSIINSSVQK